MSTTLLSSKDVGPEKLESDFGVLTSEREKHLQEDEPARNLPYVGYLVADSGSSFLRPVRQQTLRQIWGRGANLTTVNLH